MRKLVSLLLCLSLLCVGAAAHYPDITDPELDKMAETLSVAGVIDGMGDGSFHPEGGLTREQFAKIAVCILGDREKAAASLAATAFTDVSPDSWARGYISYVAEKGIISGYPDGSFGGSQVLTYAQAATVLLRCLGYTDSEIGFHWPADYVNKAETLGIGKGLGLSANDSIDRGQAAVMVYNALFTEMNGSDEKLISKTGLTVYEDAVLYGVSTADPSVMETSQGSFETAADAIGLDGAAGKQGDLYVNKDKKLVLFRDNGRESMEIVITASLRNAAKGTVDISYSGGAVSIPYGGTVYHDGGKVTALDAADAMTIGSTMNIYYDDDGRFSSAVLNSYVMEGPFTVTQDYGQIYDLFDIASAPSVIRRGVAASLEDIARFDVVYYSRANNTVYAYSDKVSGIYEKASPLKSAVTKVTVSGKEYELASASAMNKLNESPGAFAIGDYITLLLDRDGKVADAVDTSASNINDLGVVLGAYTRINESGTQEQAVKLFLADGSTMEYAAAGDYAKMKGSLVRLRYRDGKMELTKVKTVSRSGKIDKENRSFDGLWLTSDCSVLELVSNPEDGEAVVRKIRFGDIEGSELYGYQVIHAEIVGEMRDVALLYLQNVNKEDYRYGLITKTYYIDNDGSSRRTSGEYDILLHGAKQTISVGRRAFNTEAIGISYSAAGEDGAASVLSITDTVMIAGGRSIEAVGVGRIKVDGTVYKAANDFDIYRRNGIGDYTLISAEDAAALHTTSVKLYADRAVKDGGLVRLVVVE